jgi:hypothetical protein
MKLKVNLVNLKTGQPKLSREKKQWKVRIVQRRFREAGIVKRPNIHRVGAPKRTESRLHQKQVWKDERP